jgi:hypothetical protein
MELPDLRRRLEATLASDAPHVERMTIAAAVVSEVLARAGMTATLVGGGAIEFHASEVYTTSDLDFVVEGRSREDLHNALVDVGFERRGRHWVFGELFVEVPGNWMGDPVVVAQIGDLALRVVRREIVLADRIIGFKHWGATAYGLQAIALLGVFGSALDESLLRERLRAEHAEDALGALRALAATGREVTDDDLRELVAQLTRRQTSSEDSAS